MMTSDENVSNEELSLLKKQMKALKPVRVEKSTGHNSSREEIKELREQVRELREVILEMSYLPDEIQRLREAVQDLEEQRHKSDRNSKKGDVSPEDFEYLKHDVEKMHASMKKQRGELVRNLEGAFTKIDEQKEVIEQQQREIDILKKDIKIVSLKATEADNEGKKALKEASTSGYQTQSKAVLDAEAQTKEASSRSPSPPPGTRRWRPPAARPASPKNESSIPVWAKKTTLNPVMKPIIPESDSPRGTKKPTIEVKDSDSDSESDSEAAPSLPRPPLKIPDDSDSDNSYKPKTNSFRDNDSDSDDEEAIKNPPRTHRQSARTFETRRAPSTTQDKDDESDEGDEDVEIDVSEDVPAQTMQHGGGRMARRCSLESVQTIDTHETKPRKKSISLLPHKSADIFEQQRKDPVLRKLLMKGKTPNMTVRKVHGKSLVFFSDRVYIPATLREKTLEFYWKKYKKNQTPLIQLEKNCFWADMQMDFKRFDLDKRGARVELKVSAPRTIIH